MMNDHEIELEKENIKLRIYLKAIIKNLQNNMEIPEKSLGEVDDSKIVITTIDKFGSKYLRFQTVSNATTEEIQ